MKTKLDEEELDILQRHQSNQLKISNLVDYLTEMIFFNQISASFGQVSPAILPFRKP